MLKNQSGNEDKNRNNKEKITKNFKGRLNIKKSETDENYISQT